VSVVLYHSLIFISLQSPSPNSFKKKALAVKKFIRPVKICRGPPVQNTEASIRNDVRNLPHCCADVLTKTELFATDVPSKNSGGKK
jgi:hypothetical protein